MYIDVTFLGLFINDVEIPTSFSCDEIAIGEGEGGGGRR